MASVLSYRAKVRGLLLAQSLADKRLPGPLWVEWQVAPPDKRGRDEDNLRKVVQDAITLGGLWRDDSNRVIRATLFRWLDPVPGGAVHLWVRPYEPQELGQDGEEGGPGGEVVGMCGLEPEIAPGADFEGICNKPGMAGEAARVAGGGV